MAWAPSNITCLPASRASWTRFDRVDDRGREPRGDLAEVEVADLVGRRRQPVVDLGQDRRLLPRTTSSFCAEDLRVEEVLHPQADRGPPCRRRRGRCRSWSCPSLFLPRWRSNTTSRSAWYGRIRWALPDTTRLVRVDALLLERVDLAEQDAGVDDDAVADDVDDVGVQDPARAPAGRRSSARRRRWCARRCGRPGSGRPCPSRRRGCR